MNNMMFGKYMPIDSFIHRLDPRLKIGALLLLLIAVFFDAGFIGYALLGTFVIITTLLSSYQSITGSQSRKTNAIYDGIFNDF